MTRSPLYKDYTKKIFMTRPTQWCWSLGMPWARRAQDVQNLRILMLPVSLILVKPNIVTESLLLSLHWGQTTVGQTLRFYGGYNHVSFRTALGMWDMEKTRSQEYSPSLEGASRGNITRSKDLYLEGFCIPPTYSLLELLLFLVQPNNRYIGLQLLKDFFFAWNRTSMKVNKYLQKIL